ncbi:MAG: hypothetical protein P8M79_05630 [Alphaproteobacteria bacterium]|nr:hypothetical protein [Alphaproteobacteria bacterium]
MSTVVKLFAALTLLLVVGAGFPLLVLPDATLRALPGGQGERLVSIKRDTSEDAAYWYEDVSYAAKSLIWDLTSGDIFNTEANVEIEIPHDIRKQLRQAAKQPKAQPPSTPQPAPKRSSQLQREAAPAPLSIPPPADMASAVVETANPSVMGAVDEKVDDMSPSAVMAKQPSPQPTLATVPLIAEASSSPKPEASKKKPALAKAETPKKKPASAKAKTPEKKPALAKVSIPKPASSPKAPPPLAPAKQVAKVKAKKPKKVAALSAKREAQSPALSPKAVSNATPATPVKPQPKVVKPPATVSDNGADEHQRGMLHYRGNTVPKNLREAAKWFRIAAKKGHVGAKYNLGIMAFLGQGMSKDYAKAAKWFRMAGEEDHAAAQYNLGFLYYVGRGVAKDDLSAYTWIDRAASLGDEKAQKARDTLRKTLSPEILSK